MKIGLLTNSNLVSKYVCDLVQWTIKQDNIEISLLIIQKNAKSYSKFLEKITYNLIIKFELILLNKKFEHKDHFKKYDLNKFIDSHIFITPVNSNNKEIIEFNNNDREKIKDLNLDLIVQCDFNKIIGNILNIPKFGVVKFNY